MNKQSITIILLIGIILFSPSCASIVSTSSYPLLVNSSPSEANIIITNKKGIEVYSGTTPTVIQLDANSGFFGKACYQVKFTKEGYDSKTVPVFFKLDGWYFGNIIFGGLIGMLIVDPATGAMYKLDTEFLNETLTQSTASITIKKLKIYSLNEIPNEWKENLVVLSK
ncbi:MAG: hypothetical protein WC140_01105 [Bacteroidales bacterium]